MTAGAAKNLSPGPTFHAAPKLPREAPSEWLAFPLMLSPDDLAIVDVDPRAGTKGQIVHLVIMSNTGDDFTILAGTPVPSPLAAMAHGGTLAFEVLQRSGPRFPRKGWFNRDLAWALSLVPVGGLAQFRA